MLVLVVGGVVASNVTVVAGAVVSDTVGTGVGVLCSTVGIASDFTVVVESDCIVVAAGVRMMNVRKEKQKEANGKGCRREL